MKSIRRISLLILLCCLCIISASSADQQYRFVSIPGKGYLENVTVNAFAKDSYGFIWIATDNGPVVFDGVSSDKVQILDDANANIKASSLLPMPDGRMLIGTPMGLFAVKINGSSLQKPEVEHIMPGKIGSVSAMGMLGSDLEGVATSTTLYVLDAAGSIKHEIGLRGLAIRSINEYRGYALLSTDKGLYQYKDGALSALNIEGLPQTTMSAILITPNKLIVSGREKKNNNIYVYSADTRKVQTISIGDVIVSDIVQVPDGTILVGTNGDGLMCLDLQSGKLLPDDRHMHFDQSDLHNNQIYTLFFDTTGQVFIGYYMLGASYSLPCTNLFETFSKGDLNTRGMSVRNVSGDQSHLLVGTREGAYVLNLASGAVRYLSKDDLHSNLVLSSAKQNSKFYIGTYGGGLTVYDTATGALSTVAFPGRTPESVFSVSAENDNEVWLGTDAGLFVIRGDSVAKSITTLPDGMPTGNVYQQYLDSKGRLWMSAARGGLQAFSASTFKPMPALADSTLDVREIIETRDNDLIFVTYGGDVLIFGSDLTPSPHQEILSNVKGARGVVQGSNGYIWITTSDDLFRYMPKEKLLTIYDKSDGIENPNFNPGKPIASATGMLYLCNTDGLVCGNVKLPADSRTSRCKAVPTHIEDTEGLRLIKGEADAEGKFSISLPKRESHIKIFFSDFTYTGTPTGRYQYSLDGGRSWQTVGSDMSVTITNMAGGRNTLLVRQLGNPSTQTTVDIDVPADASWLSWVIAALCLAVAVYFFMLLRKRHKAAPSMPAKPAAAPASETRTQPAGEQPEPAPAMPAQEQPETAGQALPAPVAPPAASGPETKDDGQKKKYAANYMSEKECMQVVKRMNDLLRDSRMYTNPDLKIADIAHALGISSHKVSYVLSQHLQTNYYDYIYAFRIEEFKRLAREDKKQMFTLTALSEQAGFNSRATFFRAFKKAEGITPGDYMKKLREGE